MSFSFEEVLIRVAWPWCSAPMVGTRPTLLPASFNGFKIFRNSATV